MRIRLRGKTSIYEEIVENYARLIEAGALTEGEKLPSCRALASELGINPNTVERAYSELEKRGYIYTLPKKGVFVAMAADGNLALRKEAERELRLLKEAGLTKRELLLLADEIYTEEQT